MSSPIKKKKPSSSPAIITDSDEEFLTSEASTAAMEREEEELLKKMRQRRQRLLELKKRYADDNDGEVVVWDDGDEVAGSQSGTAAAGGTGGEDAAVDKDKGEKGMEEDDEEGAAETVVYGTPSKARSPWKPFEIILDSTWSIASASLECLNRGGTFDVVSVKRMPKPGSKSTKPYCHNIPRRLLDEHIAALIDIEKKSNLARQTTKLADLKEAHEDSIKACKEAGESFCNSFW